MEASVEGLREGKGLLKNRKWGWFRKQYALYSLDSLEGAYPETFVFIRIYATKAKTYACIWVGSDEYVGYGGGNVSGCGDMYENMAVVNALADTGITFSEPFSVLNETMIFSVLEAIGRAMKIERFIIGIAQE
jgi:hypothetical protein